MSQKAVSDKLSKLANKKVIIYAKYRHNTLPDNSIGENGDVYMFSKPNNSRIYIKHNNEWIYQQPSSLSLLYIYRYSNSLFIKTSVEDDSYFIEVAKDCSYNSFYNLFVMNNKTSFSTKKEAREYYYTNIVNPSLTVPMHGSIVYYELSDGNKVLEQFIGETGSAHYFKDTEWVTIWEQNEIKEHVDLLENNQSNEAFVKNRFLTIAKATGQILTDSYDVLDGGKWLSIKDTNPQIAFVIRGIKTKVDGHFICFAPILYTDLESLEISIQVYNYTDNVYLYEQKVTITNTPSQFFVSQPLEAGKEYQIFIGKPGNKSRNFYLYNPFRYYIGKAPAFMLFENDIDGDITELKNNTANISTKVNSVTSKVNSVTSKYNIYYDTNINVDVTTVFGKVAIEKGKTYYGRVKGHLSCNFRVYSDPTREVLYESGEGTDLTNGYDFTFSVPKDAKFKSIGFRTEVITTLDELSISTDEVVINEKISGWKDKVYSSYGDSVTAINNGNFKKPFDINAGSSWGEMVSDYLKFSKLYGRGIGGQAFKWGSNGGAVCFADSTGVVGSRNDSYNYDNYKGNIEVPEGTKPIRGSSCSWLRITTQYPESIKDEIDVITIMFHNDYTGNYDPDAEEVSFIRGDNTDPEWASSSYYTTYGGDYNISTTKGGIASTVMKMQAWMPNAIIVLCTPISGRPDINVSGDEIDPTLQSNMINVAKAVKDVANLMSIPCIDVYGTDGINGLNRNKYISDIIHPYKLGGRKMVARAIIGGLKGIIPNIYTDIQ